VAAIDVGLDKPKNVAVTSSRNTPMRDSIIHVDEKASIKIGTNNFPDEDFPSSIWGNIVFTCRGFRVYEEIAPQSTFYVVHWINNFFIKHAPL